MGSDFIFHVDPLFWLNLSDMNWFSAHRSDALKVKKKNT